MSLRVSYRSRWSPSSWWRRRSEKGGRSEEARATARGGQGEEKVGEEVKEGRCAGAERNGG